MAGSVNKVILVGRVGKDPEVRSFSNGGKVANFSLATSERWKDRQTGEQKERTEWAKIAVTNERVVEVVEKYVKKGALLYVEGVLRTRKWTDQQGVEKYSTEVCIEPFRGEVTFMENANSGDGGGTGQRSAGGGRSEPQWDAPSEAGGGQNGRYRDRAPSGGDSPQGNTRGSTTGPGFTRGGAQSGRDLDDEIPFIWNWQ